MFRIDQRQNERGLTLIEVLVALLVLSLGLTGLATLYLTSLSSVHSGLLSSLASSVALDFEERLWVEVARSGDGSCPEVATVVDQVQSHWSQSENSDLLGLPGLGLITGSILEGGRFVQIPISVTWCEGRFAVAAALEGDCPRERFDYTARVYCRPASP